MKKAIEITGRAVIMWAVFARLVIGSQLLKVGAQPTK